MSSELSPTLQLACDLIRRKSVTPLDAGCQNTMIARLEKLGFVCTRLRFDDVDNFWAVHGSSGPILCFAGHTDVVPAGEESQWQHAPYEPVIRDGMLYGRGAADMKGSLAAMIVACENFLAQQPNHHGRIAFLITSDEEGIALNGTVKVVEYLEQHNEKITWCVVGEPTSTAQLGDVIKNGRRGSLSGSLKALGIQGHVAYPQLARNPIHDVAPALAELAAQHWDNGNDFFPPTTFQISNFNAGTGAGNVIPGEATIEFNFRFSTEVTPEQLKQRVTDILGQHKLDYELQWILGGQPFLTQPAELVQATIDAIRDVTGTTAQLSTTGGTSDGRFIAPTGAQVIELGPVNSTIHKVNECASAADIEQLSLVYTRIIDNLLGDK